MTVVLNFTWAIALLPLLGVGVAFLAESPRRAAQVGVAFTGLAFILALVVLIARLTHAVPAYENVQTFWDLIGASSSVPGTPPTANEFALFWGIRVDPLSVAFMTSVLFCSLVIQVHALGSLRGDDAFRRFFWVAGVLTFGLLATVVSPNLFQLLIGWGVSAAAAWMLASHRWQRAEASVRALRTMILLRVADLALLAGIAMTWAKFGNTVALLPATNGQTTPDPFSFSTLSPEWRLAHLGFVGGVGARTLVVIAVLFVVAAVIRAAVGPLHLWFSGALDAPIPGVALAALAGMVPAIVLLARVYSLLLQAPHLLAALALVGAFTAAVGAVLALVQRDLLRIGMFTLSSQAALALATLGMGGFSPGVFIAFTAPVLGTVFFLVAANLVRGFRSRELDDCRGAAARMPRTTFALGGWALGVAGLSLNGYSALSATLRDAPPTVEPVSRVVEALVAAGVVVTMVVTALAAARVYLTVARGGVGRRRGFDPSRVREAPPQMWRAAIVALAGAAVATLAGIPGVGGFTAGSARIAGLTFSHFVFYGAVRQQLALDFLALAVAAVVLAGGIAAGRLLFGEGARAPFRATGRLAKAVELVRGPTPAERAAAAVPPLAVRAGALLERFDDQLIAPLTAGMGESVEAATGWWERVRQSPLASSTAAGLCVVALLLGFTVLAATGHLPVTIR